MHFIVGIYSGFCLPLIYAIISTIVKLKCVVCYRKSGNHDRDGQAVRQ